MPGLKERICTDIHAEAFQETAQEIKEKFRDWQALDTIIVLGASMDQDPKTRQWKLPALVVSDPSRVVGGHSRAIAARQIYEDGFNGVFAVTGGSQSGLDGERVSRAEVLANLMTQKYRIPEEQIAVIGQEGHGNTLGNITDTIDFLKENEALLQKGSIGLLTNEWHIVRTFFMFKRDPFFTGRNVTIKPIIADDILRERSRWHEKWVDEYQNLPEMEQREDLERSGIKDYLEGKYKPKSS